MKKNNLLLFILCFLPLVVSCESVKYKLPKKNLILERNDESQITVRAEIAAKEEERNWGFMQRKNIPEGTGMLFVFEKEQVLNFWMKNTPTPLSIAYIDKKGIITDLHDMTPFSLASVTSTRSVCYALEVPQGWYEKNNIKAGDKLLLSSMK